MRPFKRVCDLAADTQCFFERQSAADALVERWPIHQFHDQVVGTDIVQRADVWMIERSDGPPLALKTLAESLGRYFDRSLALEAWIARTIDLAHPALTDQIENLVRAK